LVIRKPIFRTGETLWETSYRWVMLSGWLISLQS
jgi:hypothetical protein